VTPAELAADPEWRRIFETDPVLNALEAARYDEATDRMLLAGIFHWPLRVGKLPVYPLTPARWSLLWLLVRFVASFLTNCEPSYLYTF